MRVHYLILLLGLSFATPAMAGRWVTVVDGSTRAVHLDTAGIQREGSRLRAWVREVYAREQRSQHTGVLYYSSNTLIDYDCRKRTFAPLFRVFYGSDAMELRRIKLDAVEVPGLVLPGSVDEQLLDKACEAAEQQAKAQQAAKARSAEGAVKAPGSAASTVGASQRTAADDKAAQAEPAEGKAAEAKRADSEPGQQASGDKVAQAKAGEGKSAGDKAGDAKEVTATDPTSPKPKAAPKTVADAGALPTDSAGKPASTPAGGAVHAAPIKIPPVALARARAHGQVLPVNTAPARPPRPKVPPAAKPAQDVASERQAQAKVQWSYHGAGAPEHWSKLDPAFAACGDGKRQSPIDIREGARLELEPIKFAYRPTPLRIVDIGHTVQINYAEGSFITVGGERFELEQFHFHKPAEERVDGRWFDMAAHLVHRSVEGRIAVVSVLFETREQPNAFLRSLWPHLPMEVGREVVMNEVVIDASQLLPETRTYFTYMGSLTVPPCSEGVRWIVLKTPIEVSPDQV
ncbi:MAG: carbonic anhydrase family protein, partial [Burkholderiales bacterium]|nr:carbonic anhydrase family protein [Burkholderiales bacterium]